MRARHHRTCRWARGGIAESQARRARSTPRTVFLRLEPQPPTTAGGQDRDTHGQILDEISIEPAKQPVKNFVKAAGSAWARPTGWLT